VGLPYLDGMHLQNCMWWNVICVGHLCHGVNLSVSVAAYVAIRHDVLQS